MEPTIKTIDTKHVEYFVLHLAGSDLYGRPRPVGRGVGADVPVPEVAAHRSRDVAVSGIENDYTFANDNGKNPLLDKARAYVENWKEAYKSNIEIGRAHV